MSDFTKPELFDIATIEKIKSELYNLIPRFSRTYKITGSKYQLYLHNSQPVRFTKTSSIEIERFYDNVLEYCKNFPYLVSHLSFESDVMNVSSDLIVGVINFEKTRAQIENQASKNVVCSVYSNNGRHSVRRTLVFSAGGLGHASGSPVTLGRSFSLGRVGIELDKLVAQCEADHLGAVVEM